MMFALLTGALGQTCAPYQNSASDLIYEGVGSGCRGSIESAWPGGKTCASPYVVCLPQENTQVLTFSNTHRYSLAQCKQECAEDQRCLGFEFVADAGTNVGDCNLVDDIPVTLEGDAGVGSINEAAADLSNLGGTAICYKKDPASCNPYFKATELSQTMLDCYCPNNRKGFYTKSVVRTVSNTNYCGGDATTTGRIRNAQANRMFHLCENWCLFNTFTPNDEMWYFDPWNNCWREQIPTAGADPSQQNYCYNVIADPNTIEIQFMNQRSTKFCAPVLGPVEDGFGCSNAADITLQPPGEIANIANAEDCRTECDNYGVGCSGSQFTTGWIAWGTGATSGGYTSVVASSTVQTILASTCKIATCSDCSAGSCKSAGTFGCPSDSSCMSVGPSAAGCGGNNGGHAAIECVNSSGNSIGTSTLSTTLLMDTGSVKCLGVSSPNCGGTPHAVSCFGPYQDSDTFNVVSGDIISWEYKALAGGDWFEVMVIILKAGVPIAIPSFRFGDAMSSFRTDTYTATETASDYSIRFVTGSYDATGGTVLGATMEVQSFQKTDSSGNGYNLCVLLGDGCTKVAISGAGVALRDSL